MCHEKILHIMLFVALGMLGTSNALAEYEPNDSYSSMAVSYQHSRFAEPICIGADCHEGVSGPTLVVVRQIVPSIALGASASYLQSNINVSSVRSSNAALFAIGIVGLGSRVDVGVSFAAMRTILALCTADCAAVGDTGTDLGVFGKVFLDSRKTLGVTLGFDHVKYQESAGRAIVTLSLGGVLAKRHRLNFSLNKALDASGSAVSGGYGLAYSYLVF